MNSTSKVFPPNVCYALFVKDKKKYYWAVNKNENTTKKHYLEIEWIICIRSAIQRKFEWKEERAENSKLVNIWFECYCFIFLSSDIFMYTIAFTV